jgi:hypothetical protein
MSRSKAINVKIATSKVIKALENKLTQIKKEYVEQDIHEAKYQKEVEKWKKQILQFANSNIKSAINVRVCMRGNGLINIDFDMSVDNKNIPQEPQRDYPRMQEWTFTQQKEELENAIRILKMTDEEYVSTSTYNSIAKYL